MQKETIRLFWRYSSPYRYRRILSLFFPMAAVLTSGFLGPLILSEVINKIQTGSVTTANTWPLIILYLTTQLLGEVVFWRIALYSTWSFEVSAQRDIYTDIFKKLSNESLNFHANRFSGSLVSQTNKFISGFERFWDTIIWQTVPVLTTIFATIIITSFYLWQYSVFILVTTVIFCIIVFFGSKFMRLLNTKEAQASTKLSGYLADMVSNIAAVKAFGNEKSEFTHSRSHANGWRSTALASMWGFLKISTAYSVLLVVVTGGALFAAVSATEHHLISIGTVYLLLTYTLNVSRQLWEMNSIMRNYNRIMGDSNDMVEILNNSYTLTDKSSTKLVPKNGLIEFKNVDFTYDNGDGENVFKSFSLTLQPGERVGIVGHSGSGKTTFTRLLLRFSDIDGGEIMIDGQNIANVSQESLRKAIAYVPQESVLFHRPLSENIAYGEPDASEEEIVEAAKKANAWEFIENLPGGLNTLVGERGVKLSGGQRQRIAIARAILKNSPILVLDEATSALDSESEKLIQSSLGELMKDRTSIVIAHRLSTISRLDRIIVLDHGKIVEDGSHADLLARSGVYSRLWNHQSGGFIEE